VLAACLLAPVGALAKGPIKVGFPIPLSGPTAVFGVPILKGADLAVADINAAGGPRLRAGAASGQNGAAWRP